jgi:hypothetical protein
MHELQVMIGQALRPLTGARQVRLFGRHEKDPGLSPIFVYLEFERLEQSQDLARRWGAGTDQILRGIWQQLVGDEAQNLRLWSCATLIEALAVAPEKKLKELMAAGEAHPCPLPPPPMPPADLAAAGPNAQNH